ncbi:MAG TPA: DUF2188 domain-containing protein [Stellaceae bacterium]|nr:DUF2188 domain-containing protein [Stellaceae bacterium]
MTNVIYEIVEHDGGWAYRVGDSYSETYRTHDEAAAAVRLAAAEQQVAGSDEALLYEDAKGVVHEELSRGSDRPETQVQDQTRLGDAPDPS